MSEGPRVGILVGSESDRERMQGATALLDEAGVAYEFEVRSAHRTPGAVAEYAQSARDFMSNYQAAERRRYHSVDWFVFRPLGECLG